MTKAKVALRTILIGISVGVLVPAYELGSLAVFVHLVMLPIALVYSAQKIGRGGRGFALKISVALLALLSFALTTSHMYSWGTYSNHRGFWGIDGESQTVVLAVGFVQGMLVLALGLIMWWAEPSEKPE